jgi:hypothetical protein
MYDFKKYHLRAINAASDQERAAINQELKDLYASLTETDKVFFDNQLQTFLTKEASRLQSDYESIKNG